MKRATYLFSILFTVLIGFNTGVAQNVYNGDLWLTTQAQIDNFNYTTVTGNLTINGNNTADITNLNGFLKVKHLIYSSIYLDTLHLPTDELGGGSVLGRDLSGC